MNPLFHMSVSKDKETKYVPLQTNLIYITIQNFNNCITLHLF